MAHHDTYQVLTMREPLTKLLTTVRGNSFVALVQLLCKPGVDQGPTKSNNIVFSNVGASLLPRPST
jgi:hypothetical protein